VQWPTTQRRVTEDHQVEQSEISCRCEQCFGAGRDSETVYGLSWHRPWVPAYQEARALGISFTDRHGGEDWVWDRLWDHQPLTSAAVSEVNAARFGSTSCQP
jgi:hypothetical protein